MRACLALVLALIVTSGAAAQFPIATQASTVKSDTVAMSIIASSLSTMGASNVPSTAAIMQTTVAFSDGTNATITSKSIGFDRVRYEVSKDGKSSTHVVNQGQGYTLINGKTRKLPLWDASRGQQSIPAFTRLSDYQNSNLSVTYVGVENVNGKPAHHIKLSVSGSDPASTDIDEAISTLHVFIDSQSLQVVKIQDFDFSPDTPTNRSVAETYFDDYRVVNGVAVPFHVMRFVAGQKYCETTVQSVELNAQVTPADFQ